MMLRSQTIALTILFVALAVIFILVGTGDLNTEVYSAQPTVTGTPVADPTSIPIAERWTEQSPGQLLYARDPALQAVILYEPVTLATFAEQQGLQLPPDDEPYPLLNLLEQIRTSLEEQAAAQSIAIEAEGLTGPYIGAVGGVPVAFFRVQVSPQAVASGGQFPGLDREWALVERAGDEVMMVLYGLQGEPQSAVYADYRDWLEVNIAALAAGGDPPAEADNEGAAGAEPEPTDEAALERGAEAAQPAEIGEPVAVEDDAELGAGPWIQLLPGQLRHADSLNAFLFYRVGTLDEFVTQLGVEPLAGDDPAPLQTVLEFMQQQIETRLGERGVTFGSDAFEGPETQVFGGVPVAYMQVDVEAQTTTDGQPIEGQELAIALIDRGDGSVAVVEFVYSGPPAPELGADWRAWLEDNAPRLADPTAALPEFDVEGAAETGDALDTQSVPADEPAAEAGDAEEGE